MKSEVIDTKSYTDSSGMYNLSRKDARQRRPVRVTEKTYEDHYECKHCGHRWTKIAKEKSQSPVNVNQRNQQ